MFGRSNSLRFSGVSRNQPVSLLAGVSAFALLAGGHGASALPLFSSTNSATAAAAQVTATTTAAQQQAAAIGQVTSSYLARVTQAITAARQAAAAARTAASQAASSVPNGLTSGGLVVDPRVSSDSSLWQNISQPSQTTSNGQTTVTLTQTSQRAVATWESFNVGSNTTVYFNQSAGNSSSGNNWIVLNRIDATGVPSQILGQIKAEGTVLIINPNGIIFTGTSQVNVGTLIASSLDIDGTAATSAFNGSSTYTKVNLDGLTFYVPPNEDASNNNFVENGLYTLSPSTGASTYGDSVIFAMGNQTLSSSGGGAIVVEAGASITSSAENGYVALIGPTVENAGSISATDGQVILAASSGVTLTDPLSSETGVNAVITVSAGVSKQSAGQTATGATGPGLDTTFVTTSLAGTGAGTVTNSGLIVSTLGAVTMIGNNVDQEGVIDVTTGTQRIGSIALGAVSGDITLGASSVTAILPDDNGGTVPAGSASGLNPEITFDAVGGGIDFQSNSLLAAPSADLTLTATYDIVLEDNAIVDLAGLANVEVPVSDYIVTFTVTANEVANSPLADALIGDTVTIDTRLSGTRSDGTTWVGSPIVDASGYADDIEETINQVLTAGGSITVNSGNFIQRSGSTINISGGYVTYTGGEIKTTEVVGANGLIYNIGSAATDVEYVGIAGRYYGCVSFKEMIISGIPILSRCAAAAITIPGYIAGRPARTLTITATTALDGTIIGDTVAGVRQIENGIGGGATAQSSLADLPEERVTDDLIAIASNSHA